MKRFYIAVILFIFPIMAFIGGAEYYIRQIPNEYSFKNGWMEEHAEVVETLVLGNSFIKNGVIPEYLGRHSYNLSGFGQTLKYDHFLFFKWADRYKKLKVVILSVSYPTFYVGNTILPDDIMEMNYKIYMDCPYHSDFSCFNFESLYFKYIHGRFVNRYDTCLYERHLGWIGTDAMNVAEYNKYYVKNKRLVKQLTAKSNENVCDNLKILSDMAAYCKKHDVRLILISTPHWKEYNQLLDQSQLTKTYSLIHHLQRQFPVEYYDYRNDSSFELNDFCDMRHLSTKGAKKFTEKLKKAINNT